MKKILFMITSMNIGGVEKSLLSLLSVIPKDKYDITLLVLEKKGGFLEFIPDWVKVEEATWFIDVKPIIMQPPQKTLKNYIMNKNYIKILPFVFSYMVDKYFDNRYMYYKQVFNSVPDNEQEYDVAIAYQGPTDVIDYYIANKVNAKKKISWIHFDVSKFNINKKLYERLYKNYNKLFVVSKEARDKLIKMIPSTKAKSEVHYNIVSKKFINDKANECIDTNYEYKGTIIVTVGRLSKEKGQRLAIKVLKKLIENGYDIKWHFVGDGKDRCYLENIIRQYKLEKYAFLIGEMTNPYPYMKKADIYVQTSIHEGYCLTLAEAKCLNKAIVTTNFTGAYEQIKHKHNGLISECSEESLYNNIKYLIDNEDIKNKLIDNIKEDFAKYESQNKYYCTYI